MTASQSVDRQTFLTNLHQSGLVSAEQLQKVADRLPDSPRGRVLARALVEMGLLTRFQAEHLLAGRTSGFFMGQYRILEQLGEGGMARVYKAQHGTMGRVVALKVLAPGLNRSGRGQELFLREIRAAAVLSHPNIVTAYDANCVSVAKRDGEADDRYYLVLEFVNGPNLDQLVREQGPLPVGLACEYARQAALGLQYAFQMGMVHRDIKPANLLLQRPGCDGTAAGTVKISDFGLARLGEQASPYPGDNVGTILVKDNTVMGTPDFLSPEQGRCLHKTDIRSDIYSLGCTLYYLLTARVPFPGGTTLEKLVRHNSEDPEPVDQLRSEVPPAVAVVLRKMMARRPDDRYQTPAEVAEVLASLAINSAPPWPTAVPVLPVAIPVAPIDVEESAEQSATLGQDQSPTPLSEVGMPAVARRAAARPDHQGRRLRIALCWAIGLVGGLLLLAALASILGK